MQPFYSSHYAQAYAQSFTEPVTTLGYGKHPQLSYPPSIWYQPGTCRCSYRGCSFMGSQKALEIHSMDRHLIYPLGWEKRPKKLDWDADPSLKGKAIPILGTNLNLDKPDDLKAWLTERKRRWPSSSRVEEKKRKMGEAIARGQLPETLALGGTKRQRTSQGDSTCYADTGRGRGRKRGNLSWRAEKVDMQRAVRFGEKATESSAQISYSSIAETTQIIDDDDLPEVVSSKALTPHPLVEKPSLPCSGIEIASQKPVDELVRRLKRPPPQPKREAHNPFKSRPPLLLNLLRPEIRATISNLSQVIKFLVDNDFLEDVEPTPGAANLRRIQVIGDN